MCDLNQQIQQIKEFSFSSCIHNCTTSTAANNIHHALIYVRKNCPQKETKNNVTNKFTIMYSS